MLLTFERLSNCGVVIFVAIAALGSFFHVLVVPNMPSAECQLCDGYCLALLHFQHVRAR